MFLHENNCKSENYSPEKCPLGKLASGKLPLIPQRKEKKKKKIDSRKNYLLGKM